MYVQQRGNDSTFRVKLWCAEEARNESDRSLRIRKLHERIAWISSICDSTGGYRTPSASFNPFSESVELKAPPPMEQSSNRASVWNSKDKQEHNFPTGDVTQPTAKHGSLYVPRRS